MRTTAGLLLRWTEDDPYQGMAMYTGMGVGGVPGSQWEDRSLLVVDHSLDLKRSDLSLQSGPAGGTARGVPSGRGPTAGLPPWRVGRTMPNSAPGSSAHNRTGYEAKPLNVAGGPLLAAAPGCGHQDPGLAVELDVLCEPPAGGVRAGRHRIHHRAGYTNAPARDPR
jgi:hypothetical protein